MKGPSHDSEEGHKDQQNKVHVFGDNYNVDVSTGSAKRCNLCKHLLCNC